MPKQVIYILGSSRTGSTMLDMMLGSHPDCASLGHFSLVEQKEKPTEKLSKIQQQGFCSLCGNTCEKWDEFDKIVRPPAYHSAAFEVFGSNILIDSSKKIHWIDLTAGVGGVLPKIIRVVRHGLDRLWTAHVRSGEISKKDIVRWIEHEQYIDKYMYMAPLQKMTVKYEDVCSGEGLQQCCSFIGIDYRPDMREFWKHEHHTIMANPKTSMLMRLHHGKPVSLTQDQQDLLRARGYKVKPMNRRGLFSVKEKELFMKYGEKYNRKQGY